MRQPLGTCRCRAEGFSKEQAGHFFRLYKELLDDHEYPASRIWNMDESGITTVQKPGMIIAGKGVRRVGKMTSADRRTLVTFVCAGSAAGVFLPPMNIFPRKRLLGLLMKDAPTQAVGFSSATGWTDGKLILQWLEHFVKFTNSSPERKHLLVLDGHHSHKN